MRQMWPVYKRCCKRWAEQDKSQQDDKQGADEPE